MFYNGYAPKNGSCAAGGDHRPQGWYFWLQHDIPQSANNEAGWRYCSKCFAIFWDGYNTKGSCPGGGGHLAQGYKFVLPLNPKPDFHARADLRTSGWAPIEGWVDIAAKPNGDVTFSGHIHNSGAIDIKFTLAAVLVAPSGQCFAFAIHDREVDGTQTIIGRNRDANWNDQKNDPNIALMWSQFSNSGLATRLVASSDIGVEVNAIKRYLNKMIGEVHKAVYNPYINTAIAFNAFNPGLVPYLAVTYLVYSGRLTKIE